ncbi:hypothetical protein Q763_16730 [Flavobacterium beibuense F44-8]|uniref:PKD domain-containing protein n=1 Tax=Flavobacterium beibuense F44-8 TaxID=1406840 RepID=A0A0A2LF81_9FLAO|nr:choice-of-anchor J domain-containing protein [Flavobacterium beibuense]KGO78772.1 hypothetical protein Q763_16730 [Flavobacterium beibuense F44-8]
MKKIIQLLLAILVTYNGYSQLSEGFEGAPDNATNGDWALSSGTWHVYDNGIGLYYSWMKSPLGSPAQPPRTGNAAAYLGKDNVPTGSIAQDWLVTPAIDISAMDNPQLKFYSRLTMNGDQGGVYKVLIIDANGTITDINNFTLLSTWSELQINPTQQEYNLVTVNIPTNSVAGQNVRLAFLKEGDNVDRWLIDDITVNSGCLEPTNLGANGITTSSANLSWDIIGQASTWEIEILETSNPFTGNGISVFQNTYAATGTTGQAPTGAPTIVPFTQGTDYKYKVRAVCGAGNYSPWSQTYYFSTLSPGEGCAGAITIPTTLPYVKVNEGYTVSGLGAAAGSGCGSGSEGYLNGKYKIFSYTPTANGTINIEMSSTVNQTAFFVYDGCNDIGVNCYATGFDESTPNKEITNLQVLSGHTYYIVVATKGNYTSRFSLIVSKNNCSSDIVADFGIQGDCVNGTFNAVANITNLGNGSGTLTATFYTESGSVGATPQTISAPGTVSFPATGNIRIVLQNNSNKNCVLLSKNLSLDLCPPVNDECANATVLSSNTTGDCYPVKGKVTGATASPEPSTCAGAEDDDVWYQFVATSSEQIIEINNINGTDTNLSHAVYEGADCATMSQIYCSSTDYSVATNLVAGQTYKIRVYSVSSNAAETTFTICTRSYPESCMDTNQYSVYVRQSFVALVNHLIGAADSIDTSVNPYTCTELSALAPYITDANPMIYNFTYAGGMLSFSFSNHSPSDPDVLFYMSEDTYLSNINLVSYDASSTIGLAGLKFTNGEYQNVRNNIRHVNFCPEGLSSDNECESVSGRIRINPGMSCMNLNTPHSFSFVTPATNIASYSWAVYNYSYQVKATSQQANPSFTFDVADSYIVRLIVTDTNGCKTQFEQLFEVMADCSNYCTEVNPASNEVKELFMDLVNHLMDIYRDGGTVTTPYTCPEMTALAPYVTDADAKVYNISYLGGGLQFSFANHTGDYDVAIQDNGEITDINLLSFSDASVTSSPAITYLNGTKAYSNKIKHVNFCPSVCADLDGKIIVNSSPSNDLALVGPVSFSFVTANTTITSYNWTFYTNSKYSFIGTSTEANPVITVNNPGEITADLVVTYGDGCIATFHIYMTVVSLAQGDLEYTCWSDNAEYAVVTEAYLNLVNHIIDIYSNGGTVPNPYTCDELDELAPFIVVDNPKIWNVDVTNGHLRFSFSNDVTVPDVIISNFAHIADITVFPEEYIPGGEGGPEGYFQTYMPGHSPEFSYSEVYRIEFCPEIGGDNDCGGFTFGHIMQSSGESCSVINTSQTFSLLSSMSNIESYNWTFYNSDGTFPILVSQSSNPSITYSTLGNYLIKLEVTNVNGCKSYFYKTVTIAASCDNACTEVNENSTSVKFLYTALLNHLLNLNGIIPEGYTCIELSALSPYLTDANPAIYNVSFNGQQLSFSFSQNDSQPDVVINDFGAISDINIYNYSSSASNTSLIVTYANGNQSTNTVKHIDFCPVVEPCESHVSFVIDESSSLDAEEVASIKRQLNAFIDQQEGSNMTISFVGMSDSDFNTRTDHVYGRVTAENKILFKNWIANYKSNYSDQRLAMGISPDSDYWASGLNHAMTAFALKPEIVIVITDGSQTANVEGLKDAVTNISNDPDSHLYVYGGEGYYVNQNSLNYNGNTGDTGISDVTGMLKTSLKFLMELPDAEYPIDSSESLISASYFEYEDFTGLEELTYFSEKLSSANIGCGIFTVEYCKSCETFQPAPGGKYWISAWVKEEQNIQVKTYTQGVLKLIFEDGDEQEVANIELLPTGDIIDGWQRIAAKFEIPALAQVMRIELINLSPNIPVYFDDIRVHPLNASMKSFVYDSETFRLMAELDDNNYSTYYEYDNEGGLVRIKKETSKGVKTIQESRSGNVIQPTN